MAKLSQQLQEDLPQERVTRSQRVKAKQSFERQKLEEKREQQKLKRLGEAQEKLSKANYDNYEAVYNSIDPEYSKGFMSPTQLKATSEYQSYQKKKRDADYIQSLISYASKMDRGKPFALGLDPPKQLVRDVNAYRRGIGTGSKAERRADYLKQKYPNLEAGKISQAVNVGTITDFGYQPQVYGLDRGETSSVVTRNKEGEVIESVTYTGTFDKGRSGYTSEKTTYLTGEKLKVAQEKAYQDFLKESKEVKLSSSERKAGEGYIDAKTNKWVSSPTESRKWYEKSLQELFIQPTKSKVSQGFSYVGGVAMTGLNKVNEKVRWDFKLGGSPSSPKLQVISFGKQDQGYDVAGKLSKIQAGLSGKAFEIKDAEIERELGTETYSEFKTGKEEQGKEDVTSLFYRSDIGKQAFLGATTEGEVDQAFEKYTQTKEFKQYQQKYSTDYTKDLNKLIEKEVPYFEKIKGTYAGLKMAGLNIGSLGLSLVKTPANLGLTAGAIYTGGAIYGSLPTSTLVGLDIAFGTAGAVKTFSPSSTFEERGAGVIMLGVSTTSLGIKGVSYARQPTIQFEKIKAPKINLRSTETIGQDLKMITNKGELNKIIYGNQKLSQMGVAGRRTIVSTKWRDLVGLDSIYKGVPYAQRGTTYYLKSLRGSTSFTTKSGYQKAVDLLVKRGGYTPYQASSTLRYIQPRVIEQYLNKGVLTIKGSTATGSFEYLTKQPVLSVDKSLGIQTRGARTIKDVFEVERKLVNLKSGGQVVLQDQTRVSFFLKRGSSPFDFKDMQYSRGLIVGKASELKSGLEILKSDIKGINLIKEIKYQDLSGVSFSRNVLPSDNILRIDTSRTKLIKRLIDVSDDFKPFKTTKIKKTPLSQTFGSGDDVQTIKNIIKDVNKVSANTNINKIIDKIDDFGGSLPKAQSQFTESQVKTILKQSIAPPKILIKQQIKGLIDYGIKSQTGIKSSVLVGTASALALKDALKLDVGLKMDLKVNSLIKQQIKIKQAVSQRSATAQLTKQINEMSFVQTPSFSAPIFNQPRIIEPKIRTPIIPFYLPPAITGKGKKKKKGKQVQDLLILPDFTSKVIGLEAESVTEKQAQARLKKILTGLEIRRGIIIQ